MFTSFLRRLTTVLTVSALVGGGAIALAASAQAADAPQIFPVLQDGRHVPWGSTSLDASAVFTSTSPSRYFAQLDNRVQPKAENTPTPGDYTLSYPVDLSGLHAGVHTVYYSAIDTSGNKSELTVRFVLDPREVVPVVPELVPSAATGTCPAFEATDATISIPGVEGITYRDATTGQTLTGTLTFRAADMPLSIVIHAMPTSPDYRLSDGATSAWTFSMTAATSPCAPEPVEPLGDLRLTKSDLDDPSRHLRGAVYVLTPAAGGGAIDLPATDEHGVAVLTDLALGDYVLTEKVAPVGYQLSRQGVSVTIVDETTNVSVTDEAIAEVLASGVDGPTAPAPAATVRTTTGNATISPATVPARVVLAETGNDSALPVAATALALLVTGGLSQILRRRAS